jgi:hypothetical protein
MSRHEDRTPHEQIVYARWLDWGTRAGLAVLIGTFAVYLVDWAVPHVPFEQVARAWSLPVADYRAAVGAPDGWGWVALATHSDYANYTGIALLCLVTIVCYLRALPGFLARGDRAYAAIAAAQIAVLGLAAAGVLGGGH